MELNLVEIIGLTVALVEALKHAGLNLRLLPIASIAMAMLLALLTVNIEGAKDIVLVGILAGMAASGFYDIGKKTLLGR